MHFSLLIAVSLCFGRISFDLVPVADALTKAMEHLQQQNYRVVTTLVSDHDANGKPVPDHKPSQWHSVHYVSPRGEYYRTESTGAATRILCRSEAGVFECHETNGSINLGHVTDEATFKDTIRKFSLQDFRTLLTVSGFNLRDLLDEPDLRGGKLSLDRDRVLIWGRLPARKLKDADKQFIAIVRFNPKRTLAFIEWISSHYHSKEVIIDSITTSEARFHNETLDYRSSNEVSAFYNGMATQFHGPVQFIGTNVFQTECRHETDITDDQLVPEYYGLDRHVLKQVLEERHQPRRSARHSSPGRYDMPLALGIPVVLLVVLLLVIRKT
jgi:hypothetical protein